MHRSHRPLTRFALAPLSLAIALSLGALSVHAQTAPAVQVDISITAQPLAQALTEFARQARLTLMVPPALVAGRTAPAVSGRLTPRQALDRLLMGSGLMAVQEGNSVVVKAIPPAEMTTTLPVVTVTGASIPETASGPVKGFVAKRSAAATKTDTPLIETPQSVSVVGRDQMTAQGVQTVGEALRYTAGVVAEEYGGTDLRIDQYMVRGFASSMPYLDGLNTGGRYTLMSESVEPYGLERVEVLRGPSSVLYGQNIPGGLVSLVSKRPTDVAFGEAGFQVGSQGRTQGTLDLGGPLDSEGKLSYRLTALARGTGTQVDQVDAEHYYLAPSLTWKPSTDTTLTVLAKIQKQSDGYALQYLPADGTLYSNSRGRIPTDFFTGEPDLNKIKRTQSSIGYSLEHRVDDVWTLRQNLRASRTQTDIGYVYAAGLQPGTTSLSRYTLAADAHQNNLAVDTQAQARFKAAGLDHTLLLGVDYFRSHDRWIEQDGDAAPLDILQPVYGRGYTLPAVDYATDDTLKQMGLYVQDQVRWDRLVLTGSLRHDQADTDVTDLLASSTVSQKNRKTTGRAGLVYLFDNGIAPYVSYSTSFNPALGTTYAGTPFRPTTGKQYEAGVKYQPAGSNSSVTGSIYQLTQRNGLTADPDHPYFRVQAGEVRVRGAELSGTTELSKGLKAVAAYTYTDAAITQGNDGNTGNTPKDIPRQMASLWLEQRVSGSLAGLRVGGGIRYVGYRYGNDANTLRIPGTALVDAMIGYDLGQWSVVLNARNLFDKTYVATCDSTTRCVYGQRRSLLATATYRW
jgi:iron complex outermembrane recepter protein